MCASSPRSTQLARRSTRRSEKTGYRLTYRAIGDVPFGCALRWKPVVLSSTPGEIRADATSLTLFANGTKTYPAVHGLAAGETTYDLFVGAQTFHPAVGSTRWTFAFDDVVCR